MRKLLSCASFIIVTIISCLLPGRLEAQYKVSGQLNNFDSLWLNGVNVSAIDSLKHLYYASADMIINKDSMNKQGHFTISGNNLPDENRIYRLDLTDVKNAMMISSTNHIFLILNNHSAITVTCPNFSRSSFDYKVEGSEENAALQKLEYFINETRKLFNNPNSKNGTGKTFAENRFNTNIRNYCDTCRYAIVAVMGMSEIIDIGKDYKEHPDFYKQFLNRIKGLPGSNSIYVKEFEGRLDILSGSSTKGYFANPLIYIEGIIILFLSGFVWYLLYKLRRINEGSRKNPEQDKSELFETLTRREKEILSLLIEDNQNKEIANKLNLEVSTIKTHIGKIYQKLAIGKRNEVKIFEPYLKNKNEINI